MGFPKYTERLGIQHMLGHPLDLRTIVGWLNDPEVVKYSEQRHKKHDIQTQLNFYAGLTANDRYLSIFYGNRLIGTMTAHIDPNNAIANVGILMGEKSTWGRGFGIEAWRAVCDELFADGIRKVEAGCMAANTRMMIICQKYGMVEEGRQDKHFQYCKDLTTDLVHWGKFNEAGT